MKIAIVGSRGYPYPALVEAYVDSLPEDTVVVSGGAADVDTIATSRARARGLPEPLIFLPDWKRYGRAAGPIRNEEIVRNAGAVTAFWDEKSRGTASTIRLARKYRKPLTIYGKQGVII